MWTCMQAQNRADLKEVFDASVTEISDADEQSCHKGPQITLRDADSLHATEGGVAETWLPS